MTPNAKFLKRTQRILAVGGAALLVAGLAGTMSRHAMAQSADYVITRLATLGDAAPGGASFTFDFEPWSVNNRGQVAFGADLTTGGEGIFLASHGQISQIARTGQADPNGSTFAAGFLGLPALNNQADVAFTFALEPFTFPLGVNAGVYRFSHIDSQLHAVLVPNVTPAPGGGTFTGATFHASLNNPGDITFTGIVPATIGPGAPIGLGQGIFRADKSGRISIVVRPGDSAPGGGIFDLAQNAWINDAGDVAFGGHVAGEECITEGQDVPGTFIFCAESVYLKNAATGNIQSIAHQGDPAPGGGLFRVAFGPV